MKIKKIEIERGRIYPPTLTMNGKRGLISISASACQKLGVTVGDRIEFFQDEDEPENWYLAKSANKDGYKLQLENKQLDRCRFYHKNLVTKFLKENNLYENERYKFRLAPQPMEIEGWTYWGILIMTKEKSTI